ncbi:spore germination protein GerPC [Pseudoneobacillus sp. C159]
MMNSNYIDYIHRLHAFVESQDRKIRQLEKTVGELVEEIKTLKNKPPIQIDRIEYKFDQLKVERLDGTLNIGLNPSDLQGIEDFAVNNQQPTTSPTQLAYPFQCIMRIESSMLPNLDQTVNQVVQQYEQEHRVKIDETYVNFIKDDVKKQLPNRIHYHLNQIPAEQRGDDQQSELDTRIIELLYQDIHKGIYTFLNNLPIEAKGMN